MSRKARAKLASETLDILEKGHYTIRGVRAVEISEALHNCLSGTQQFGPDELFSIHDKVISQPTPSRRTTLEVINESTLSGASHLCHAFEGRRVGVLNFASAKKPGGGFLGGCQAQEESLARSSGLYKSLLQCPEYYKYHRAMSSLLYSHSAIYSPSCPVFRNDSGDLLPEPYQVDFVTCPAPNAGAVYRHQPWDSHKVVPVLRERVTLILGLALHFEVAVLVLGAWGCGVFQNDPNSVAKAFRDALGEGGEFQSHFRSVRFSVLGRATYRVFSDTLQMESPPSAGGDAAE